MKSSATIQSSRAWSLSIITTGISQRLMNITLVNHNGSKHWQGIYLYAHSEFAESSTNLLLQLQKNFWKVKLH